MNARAEWSARFIAAAPNAPEFGSSAWLALPEGSLAKVAAVVRAAECWARDGDELVDRLRREVLALSRANKQAEDAEYVAQMAAPLRSMPDAAEIESEFWDWVRGAA